MGRRSYRQARSDIRRSAPGVARLADSRSRGSRTKSRRSVPRGGLDFIYGNAFPHETNMDRLHGVDFDKGCYVGQEVVSRMQHRGTARTRTVRIVLDGPAPAPGETIVAGERSPG